MGKKRSFCIYLFLGSWSYGEEKRKINLHLYIYTTLVYVPESWGEGEQKDLFLPFPRKPCNRFLGRFWKERRKSIGINFNYRSGIDLATMQEPKEDAEEQDATVDGDGPVHGYSRDDGAWRPKGEEDCHEAVGDGENVDGDAETAEVEGTPAHDARRGGESFHQ